MINPTQFFYVRHGQTDWNLNRKLQGNTDVPLNQTGIAQAHVAKQKLAGQPITQIFSSPLQRARKTANIINEQFNLPITEIDGLRESNFGIHEGTFSYGWLADWLAGNDATTPREVEPLIDFMARGRAAINEAIANPGPVLIVAHGGVYIPINEILAKGNKSVLPNCQPVRLDPPNNTQNGWCETYL